MPGPSGFDPISTALAFTGAVWASRIHVLFLGSRVYLVVLLLGLVWALIQAVRTHHAWPVALYFLVTATVFAAFGSSLVPVQFEPSMAEQNGARVTEEFQRQATNFGDASLPRGFLLLDRAFQDTTAAMIRVVNADFLKHPFGLLWAVNRLALEKFDGKQELQQQVSAFDTACYQPAVTAWTNDPRNQDKLPLSAATIRRLDTLNGDLVTRLYGSLQALPLPEALRGLAGGNANCQALWAALKPQLTLHAFNTLGKTKRFMNLRGTIIEDEDNLNQMLRNFTNSEPRPGASAQPTGGLGSTITRTAAEGLFGLLSKVKNYIQAAGLSYMIHQMLPPIYGGILMGVYMLYPLVLALALLPNQIGRLVTYFILLWSIKLWPLIWAMVDVGYKTVLPYFVDVAGGLDGASFPFALQIAAPVMMLLAPALVSIVLGTAGHRLGSAIGSWSTVGLKAGIGPVGIG